jgi:predicted DCC family thiol-disulfide oxidoreductase YuxK
MSDATLVYDDDCGFCTWWAELLGNSGEFRIVGFSDISPALSDRLPATYEECAHLVTDDAVYSCGASIEEAFVRSEFGADARPVVDFLRNFEEYERARERAYSWVADRRDVLGTITSKEPPARSPSDDPEDQ